MSYLRSIFQVIVRSLHPGGISFISKYYWYVGYILSDVEDFLILSWNFFPYWISFSVLISDIVENWVQKKFFLTKNDCRNINLSSGLNTQLHIEKNKKKKKRWLYHNQCGLRYFKNVKYLNHSWFFFIYENMLNNESFKFTLGQLEQA